MNDKKIKNFKIFSMTAAWFSSPGHWHLNTAVLAVLASGMVYLFYTMVWLKYRYTAQRYPRRDQVSSHRCNFKLLGNTGAWISHLHWTRHVFTQVNKALPPLVVEDSNLESITLLVWAWVCPKIEAAGGPGECYEVHPQQTQNFQSATPPNRLNDFIIDLQKPSFERVVLSQVDQEATNNTVGICDWAF